MAIDPLIINIFFGTLGCFLFGVFGLPFAWFRLSFELRLYSGLFSVCVFLVGKSLTLLPVVTGSLEQIFLVSASVVIISLFAYLLTILFVVIIGKIDRSFMFFSWYSGLTSFFYAYNFYIVALAMLCVGIIVMFSSWIINKMKLFTVVRTLKVTAQEYDDIATIDEVLHAFRVTIFSKSLSRQNGYTLTCSYRIPILSQHILSRYLFKSEKFIDIDVVESE